jgi:hypothetical protein
MPLKALVAADADIEAVFGLFEAVRHIRMPSAIFRCWCTKSGVYVLSVERLCTTGRMLGLFNDYFVDGFSFVRKPLFFGFFICVDKK